MQSNHHQAECLNAVQAQHILQRAKAHLSGMDHEIIARLSASLILLLQEQNELQYYHQIDMWDFVMEVNHCLQAVGILLEEENRQMLSTEMLHP